MSVEVAGFEVLKELYKDDLDCGEIFVEFEKDPYHYFLLRDEYIFNGNCFFKKINLSFWITRKWKLVGHFGEVLAKFKACMKWFVQRL